MPSLLGCLFIGVAIGLLCRTARLCRRGEGMFFVCTVAACGAVLGGLAAAPLLGFVSSDAAHFTLAEALGSIVGSAAVMLIARALPVSMPASVPTPDVYRP
jgi:uncharacterized membrane protein YeaQ/YmgE (transglycosylase-associated protein family)